MSPPLASSPFIEALLQRGRPTEDDLWAGRNPDYVAEYGLTADHVPVLINIATRWDEAWYDTPAAYAPIHAWRALAQLGAVDAVQPLLDFQRQLEEQGDDWYLEEFHLVFGLIGPPAIESMAAFLADPSQGEFPRSKTAEGLAEIARRHPETRARVLEALTSVFAHHQKESGAVNGGIVGDLLDLHAVEAAEIIERAFAANVIDPTIVGDWGEVRRELGVLGLGLAPDKSVGWKTLAEQAGFPRMIFVPPSVDRLEQQRRKDRAHERKAKAKRKQQQKDRKRNRKAR